jgi:anti-anti-sigma factor
MTQPTLTVTTTTPAPGVVVLSVVGQLDHDSRLVLGDAADAALEVAGTRLIVDLDAVTFCDSGGMSLLVDLHRRAAARGGRLHLARVGPPITAVLLATNLDRLLPVHPTVAAAVQAGLPTG